MIEGVVTIQSSKTLPFRLIKCCAGLVLASEGLKFLPVIFVIWTWSLFLTVWVQVSQKSADIWSVRCPPFHFCLLLSFVVLHHFCSGVFSHHISSAILLFVEPYSPCLCLEFRDFFSSLPHFPWFLSASVVPFSSPWTVGLGNLPIEVQMPCLIASQKTLYALSVVLDICSDLKKFSEHFLNLKTRILSE